MSKFLHLFKKKKVYNICLAGLVRSKRTSYANTLPSEHPLPKAPGRGVAWYLMPTELLMLGQKAAECGL